MYSIARKHLVRITLDIDCYEDLVLDNLDWEQFLGLEGDEDVDVSIRSTREY
jgi:hypothetical protein